MVIELPECIEASSYFQRSLFFDLRIVDLVCEDLLEFALQRL